MAKQHDKQFKLDAIQYYVAKEYKKATEHMQHSYSKKAFPWDNACIESFHH